MSEQEWEYYIKTHLSQDDKIVYKNNFRLFHVYDHGDRLLGLHHRVTWTGNLLPLYNSYWYFIKWDKEGQRFRSRITSLGLIHHSYTSVVKLEFTYKTWFWDSNLFKWIEI